jgi:transcriptional regulator with XRE-family HTH domain|uniref:Repressor protein CI n=1 Tax=Myoviridae sp. ctiu99 TaxID=2825158 RepID=A0A8S5NVL0_9CAUD|nr:MAG TPA: Repressor protein CI [Myoviridae sp. ctiu99]
MPRNKLSKFDRELREIISENLKKHAGHLTQAQLSEITGIPASTLSGYFAMRSTPNAGNVQKIADALHLQKSDIDPRFSPEFLKTGTLKSKITAVELTAKDEREIESDLEDMMNSMVSAAYDGQDNIEDIEAFKATIKAAMIQAKKLAKKKYTPKKYRKD